MIFFLKKLICSHDILEITRIKHSNIKSAECGQRWFDK